MHIYNHDTDACIGHTNSAHTRGAMMCAHYSCFRLLSELSKRERDRLVWEPCTNHSKLIDVRMPLPILRCLEMDIPERFEDLDLSSSSLDTTVSRMLDDENIIDSFFYICDADKKGTVAVSKLLEFIVNTTENVAEVLLCGHACVAFPPVSLSNGTQG